MSTTFDTNKTEELIVSVPREIAEKVRVHMIMNYCRGTWYFVHLVADNKAELRATNEWGGRLAQEFLTLLQQKAAEFAGVEPPPPPIPVPVPEKIDPTSGGSSAVQEP